MSEATQWHLVGDIGGTNARFGLFFDDPNQATDIASYRVADFPTFTGVLHQLMADAERLDHVEGPPASVCLAVAGPPHGDTISFTNSPWRFSIGMVEACTGAPRVRVINDFAAVARALPALSAEDLEQIGEGHQQPGATQVALGPGTGLGVAALVPGLDGRPSVVHGEGGHVDFAPVTDVEIEIFKRLRAQFGRVSIERLLCGDGIVNLYRALCDIHGVAAQKTSAGNIGSAAQQNSDPICAQTLRTFFTLLGSSAGNFALSFGALGGVFIAGGIAPRYVDLLRQSEFRARFLMKGRLADYLSTIPTFLITRPNIGLLGAALSLTD
ncbi:glucokinase [Luminiphilus syltensis NOR5-1B]|uniref:Glucokinase n=1 Tax=Luminiphilus syltensis NOR5-1B TaxID=565045 RepID=B8KWX8_9GAMM|nr:glucokinase [Luminiphilus syltensis]EED34926.1 glucokinase [Luminiphilus syltensis NOR5-1B]